MLFLTPLLFSLWSLSIFYTIFQPFSPSARLSLPWPWKVRPTGSDAICWNTSSDKSKNIMCLSVSETSFHLDHAGLLDHLQLIISYTTSEAVASPQICDLSSETFCFPSHFYYSYSQGHFVLSDSCSHFPLHQQNFQFCVTGGFQLQDSAFIAKIIHKKKRRSVPKLFCEKLL